MKFLVIPILVLLVSAQTYSVTDCACSQLLSQADCTQLNTLNCAWDSENSKCKTSSTPTPIVSTEATYCDSFKQANCPTITGCAWVSSRCTFFTGCTPFAKTTDVDCQAISTKCITDGTHCIEQDVCSSYMKQAACVKNIKGQYCYWDNTSNTCNDVTACSQLPQTLASDSDCRAQISTCTAQTGGGCTVSGPTCKDQLTEISCFWDKLQTQACYWTGSICIDRTCSNAPTSLITDDTCKAFTVDGTCTTKSDGGCITRTSCSASNNMAACVTDASGNACYWNGDACVDQTCANAPSTLTTNIACQQFLSTCITTGSGCSTNGACSVAIIEEACDKNSSGNDCVWNLRCLDKTCANSPATNNTHDLCTTYLSSCTVASNGQGCQTRTCENAPTSITSNSDCETYLPNNNCVVASSGAGCVTNGACSTLGQIACVLDINGKSCFWNGTSCVDKTCVNALATNTTHDSCQAYSTNCTVNSAGAGCVDYTCENSLTTDICTKDYTGQTCLYKGGCFQKQCVRAPQSVATHADCQNYLSSCTLSNSGFGCVPLPLKCEAITLQAACQMRATSTGTASCGWNGTQCIDKDCTTLDKTLVTSFNCNAQLAGCVSANPVNSTVSGCIALPATCSSRLTQDNCEALGLKDCVWINGTCSNRTCLTATIQGTTGVVNAPSASNCANYQAGCLLSNNGASCIAQVTNCNLLTIPNNCIDGAKIGGSNCYWIASQNICVDKVCSSITLTTHLDCYQVQGLGCTVNSTLSACQALTACSSYTTANQCQVNSSSNPCFWTGTACRDRDCTDSPNSSSYTQLSQCQNYTIANGTCNIGLIGESGYFGCINRQASCTSYTVQQQCVKDNTNNDCFWHNNQCWVQSSFTCTNITLSTYSDQNCEQVLYSCKANGTTACQIKICNDYSTVTGVTGGAALTTDAQCSALLASCTIDLTNNNICQTKQAHCSSYASIDQCTFSNEGTCIWDSVSTCYPPNTVCSSFSGIDDPTCSAFRPFCTQLGGLPAAAACISHVCSDKTGTGLSQNDCQNYDSSCSVNNNGTACVAMQSDCTGYTAGTADCYISAAGYCVVDTTNSNACIDANATNCNLIVGTGLTDAICKQYNAACFANRFGTACYIAQSTCAAISSLDNCTHATSDGQCVASDVDSNSSATCTKIISGTTTCAQLYLGTGNYSNSSCNSKMTTCKANDGVTACTDRTCTDLLSPTQFSDCNNYLNSCTFNGTTCVVISATCASQTSSSCYHATEGDCTVSNGNCILKTCALADISLNSHSACTSYLSTCTAQVRIGGCINNSACSSYSKQYQCNQNASGASCYWSTSQNFCLDFTCDNIDKVSTYNSHSACNTKLNKCTVSVSNGAVVYGCQSLETCTSYLLSDQCYINANSGVCVWDSTNSVCLDKSCTTAPTSTNTHAACLAYFGTNACTVAAVAGINGGANTLGGCIPVESCSSYIDAEQCHINDIGGQCGWNGTACLDFSCLSSPPTNNTDTLCNAYKSGCTLDQSGSGCMSLLQSCENYQIQGNCIQNTAGSLCYWNSTISKCVTKTCDNAPDATQCSSYLSMCTSDNVKCKTQICEDFQFTTDTLCTTALTKCTTDGTQCVLRGTCFQALNQAGCVTDLNGNQCEWIPANENSQAYCTLKSCSTASIILYATDDQCSAYFPNCTAKSGGGCVIKTTCAATLIQEACTTALDGTACQWDSTTSLCRNQDCQDYTGSTHVACQAINASCTAGLNGQCAKTTTCTNTLAKAGCIQGSDGPCLWIVDTTGTGKCYPFTSCQSVSWKTDSQCKLISSNCTTDGAQCVGITLCSETNSNGGCVTGYDGDCLQTVTLLGSTDPFCKAFTSCTDALFDTHQACQIASTKCTTNGITGCVPLDACSNYKQAACYINAKGAIISNGFITSTGVCTWDTTAQTCRDQNCSDLQGTTHQTCNSQLSTCTSDGNICIQKSTCSTYDFSSCGVSVGTDGICFWQGVTTAIATAVCRVKVCSDIQNGIKSSVCASALNFCISDGSICIAKANCSTYTTQTACNSGGLDGICVFTASTTSGVAATGTCALMTSCSQANNDEAACIAAKTRCAWTASTVSGIASTSSICTPHTCASYKQTNNVCANYLNWSQTSQQVCQIIKGKCTETDPSTLTQENCYSISGYTYTWNSQTSECGVCTSASIVKNTTNSTNTTVSTVTESGFVLSLAILGYVLF